jgi:glutamate synthase (NADPH/NADH) small chain
MRYGIPDFKMQKEFLDRRLTQMEAEGVTFKPSSHIGKETDANELRGQFDAVLLAGGSTQARDLTVPGRELKGVYFAMEYLPMQNRRNAGDEIPEDAFISAEGKRVIILGGGDTGADCLGTAIRQGAREILQFELLPRPPANRPDENPWPTWPNIYRVSAAHEEGGVREYSILTKQFLGKNGRVEELQALHVEFVDDGTGRRTMKEVPDTAVTLKADLVLLAMGFLGPERKGMLDQLGVTINERGNVATDADKMTSVPGIFAAGDMARGQSLVVWAIREGRQAAKFIDKYLMGSTDLP